MSNPHVVTAGGSNYNVTAGTVTISSPNSLTAVAPPSDQTRAFNGIIVLAGGDLDDSNVLYPEMFLGHQKPAMWFHVTVWEKIFGETYRDYAVLSVNRGIMSEDHLLVFGSKATRQAFRRWWRKYRRLYDGNSIETDFLPTAVASKRIKGAIIRFEMKSHVNATRDVWSWIIENSRARVWRVPDAFVFANDVDAVAFKLKWC